MPFSHLFKPSHKEIKTYHEELARYATHEELARYATHEELARYATHEELARYATHEELARYATHEVAHEDATSYAFQKLLDATCKKADWHLVPQLSTRIRGKQVRPDGTLRDDFNLHRGYWRAKDSADKIDVAYEG